MAVAPIKEVPKEILKAVEPKALKRAKVTAKFPPFIELHTNTSIGVDPVEIEITPWVQANIDRGLLIEA